MHVLRLFRCEMLVRSAWAQALRQCTTEETLQQLSGLAKTLIVSARDWLYCNCCDEWGTPCNDQGKPQPLLILGMGKLGGWELGYSSDLDLVFLVDCPPEVTTDGERSTDGRQFYLRLAQRVMQLFSTRTSSGILYEVDARLRPSGAAGLLVSTLGAFADYQQHELDLGASGSSTGAHRARRPAIAPAIWRPTPRNPVQSARSGIAAA